MGAQNTTKGAPLNTTVPVPVLGPCHSANPGGSPANPRAVCPRPPGVLKRHERGFTTLVTAACEAAHGAGSPPFLVTWSLKPQYPSLQHSTQPFTGSVAQGQAPSYEHYPLPVIISSLLLAECMSPSSGNPPRLPWSSIPVSASLFAPLSSSSSHTILPYTIPVSCCCYHTLCAKSSCSHRWSRLGSTIPRCMAYCSGHIEANTSAPRRPATDPVSYAAIATPNPRPALTRLHPSHVVRFLL